MINPWHHLEPGPKTPDNIYVIVEIPKGSRNKYEYDKDLAMLKLDRVLVFNVYKDLEVKRVEPIGWEHHQVAQAEIMQAIARYQMAYG